MTIHFPVHVKAIFSVFVNKQLTRIKLNRKSICTRNILSFTYNGRMFFSWILVYWTICLICNVVLNLDKDDKKNPSNNNQDFLVSELWQHSCTKQKLWNETKYHNLWNLLKIILNILFVMCMRLNECFFLVGGCI